MRCRGHESLHTYSTLQTHTAPLDSMTVVIRRSAETEESDAQRGKECARRRKQDWEGLFPSESFALWSRPS